MQIFVVIPAHNEAKRLAAVLTSMPSSVLGHPVRTVVVDDGSRDGTREVARAVEGVKVLRHRINLGKGAAAKTGCDAAYRAGADLIVLMDGDGQHRAEDIARLIEPLVADDSSADAKNGLVIGTRKRNKNMPTTMRLGNTVMNRLAKMLFGITVRDTQSGFRAFHREVYPKIRWAAANYEMEMEMLILAYTQGLTVSEVGIATIYHDNYKGTTALDGLRILRTLLKWRILWFREYNSLESFSH